MLTGWGAVFFGETKRSDVWYRVGNRPEGRLVDGEIHPVDDTPAGWEKVPDVVKDRLTLRLECGCRIDFFVAGHILGSGLRQIKGTRYHPEGAPAHGHASIWTARDGPNVH